MAEETGIADDGRIFETLKPEQERLRAVAESTPEPEGYDAWLREQVETSLREAADPATKWITHEDAEAEIEQQIRGWHERLRSCLTMVVIWSPSAQRIALLNWIGTRNTARM